VTRRWDDGDVRPYDHGDERKREAWARMLAEYANFDEGLEPGLARRLLSNGVTSFVELGGGNGPISQLLAPEGVRCTLVDREPTVWDGVFRPVVTGDLRALPFPDGAVDGASAINCLYFLADPRDGIREAHRVLRSGGTFVAGAPSRYHDVELRDVDPRWGEESPFDAEEAADHVAAVFGADNVEIEEWEYLDCWVLPTYDAVVDYLYAFSIPEPEERAKLVTPPIGITKKGTNVWAVRA
jgi:SAM-dependent methyltransferase